MTDGNHSAAWYSKYVMYTERFELIRPMGGNLDESWNLQESGKMLLVECGILGFGIRNTAMGIAESYQRLKSRL